MSYGTKIGIVTAAGYTEAERYYGRLHGLLEAIKTSTVLTPLQKENLVVMGRLVSLPTIQFIILTKWL
jgi:IMP and pyridine-specific 5'-nucleotidase